jgi:hypothetical protein
MINYFKKKGKRKKNIAFTEGKSLNERLSNFGPLSTYHTNPSLRISNTKGPHSGTLLLYGMTSTDVHNVFLVPICDQSHDVVSTSAF